MNFFDDMILVYKTALQRTCTRIKKNPVVLILPLLFGLCYRVGFYVFQIFIPGNLGIIGGFLPPIFFSLILSAYYTMLSDLNYYQKISFRHLGASFKNLFSSIYSVYFIILLLSWILPTVTRNMTIYVLVYLVFYLLFNPIAEVIYIQGDYYVEAYQKALNFMRNNALLWLIPLVIYGILTQLMGFMWSEMILQSSIIDIPLQGHLLNSLFGMQRERILLMIPMELIGSIYIVFRGALFDILYKSSRRKRVYMGGEL